MLANPLELFPDHRAPKFGNERSDEHTPHPTAHPERRTRVRTTVHWPIVLFRYGSSDAIESVTQNLSSNGFYCHSEKRISPGEFLICAIKFPSHDLSGHESTRLLECRVEVKRVESAEAGNSYGIACHIQDYRLTTGEETSPAAANDRP